MDKFKLSATFETDIISTISYYESLNNQVNIALCFAHSIDLSAIRRIVYTPFVGIEHTGMIRNKRH